MQSGQGRGWGMPSTGSTRGRPTQVAGPGRRRKTAKRESRQSKPCPLVGSCEQAGDACRSKETEAVLVAAAAVCTPHDSQAQQWRSSLRGLGKRESCCCSAISNRRKACSKAKQRKHFFGGKQL